MYRRTQEELKIECVGEYLWFQSPSFRCQRLTFKGETHNKQAVILLNEKTENYIVNKLSFYGMRKLITNSFQLFLTAQYLFHTQILLSRYISVVHCYCQDIIFYCKYC